MTAAANMASIAQQLEKQYPDSNRGQGAAVLSLSEVIVGNIRPILLMLLVGFFAFTELRGGQDKSGFNQARFDRSGGLRVAVWVEAIGKVPDAPWGVGPGSVRGLDLNTLETELHSEPLAFLVERGVIVAHLWFRRGSAIVLWSARR